MDADRLLDGLNESQIEAVTAQGGPVVVHAGAGSGKTRVLTRRIAWRCAVGETDPQRVLALTFTRKAAGELRQRLTQLGMRENVVAGTFHGIALMQLRRRWAERGVQPPAILDRKYRFVAQIVGRQRGVEPLDVIAEIEWARARLVSPEHYAGAADIAGRTPPLPAADIAGIMEEYQRQKVAKRMVDFDDLLSLALRDIQVDGDYAASIRWRHRHLYVDEFQDVNPLQYELLRAWRGESNDLFIVGDPNQAIYGWNGADPNLLQRFAQRERATRLVTLSDNYRSTPQVLALSNGVLGGKGGQLIAHNADGPIPTVTSFASDEAEADGVATAILKAKSVTEPWSHQAVLVRTNAQLVAIEHALGERSIPVRVRGGVGPLDTPEVKAELRMLTRAGIDVSVALNNLDGSLETTDEEVTQAEQERRSNLAALSRLVHEYLSIDPDPTGPNLAAWIATIQGAEVDAETDAVELATFHAAKGLEWPVVHLAGIEKGFVPITYAETGAQIAEEQRLLYVAITRAERELHITWASERTFGTRRMRRQPSPWLDVLQSTIDHLAAGYKPADWRAAVAKSRRSITNGPSQTHRLKVETPDDDPVFDALRQWRRRQAKAADVPAFVIFNDKTLKAIAKQRPTTKAKLAAISGVGPAKLSRFGDDVLEIVRTNL